MEINENLSLNFYGLLGSAIIGLLGGFYYIYKNYKYKKIKSHDSEQLKKHSQSKSSTNAFKQINEVPGEFLKIKNDSEESMEQSSSEFVISLYKKFYEVTDELFKKQYPDWIAKRRVLQKNNKIDDYFVLCENMLSEKLRIESIVMEETLQKFGLSQTDYQNLMEKIPISTICELQKDMVLKESGKKQIQKNFPKRSLFLHLKLMCLRKMKWIPNLKILLCQSMVIMKRRECHFL